jgi:hypothetical protein
MTAVVLDTVIFSASDFLHLTEKLQLDLHEPPMSQVKPKIPSFVDVP